MAEIRVSPERLRSEASNLQTKLGEVDNVLNSMTTAINNLQGEWTGMAQIEYTQRFNDEVPQMRTRLNEILERLTSELRRVADVFEETDQTVVS